MSTKERLGSLAANAMSFARPIREVAKFGQKDEDRGWVDTAGDAASAALDFTDGLTARATGGTTAFGGVADQLVGDKMQRWLKDFSMARRDRISWVHPAMRFGRDLAVTWYREKTMREMEGMVSVDATPKKDPWSGKYSTVNYLVSNMLIDSPIGAEMPRWQREFIATITDAHIVVTGIANVLRLKKMSQTLPSGEPEPETETEAQEAA